MKLELILNTDEINMNLDAIYGDDPVDSLSALEDVEKMARDTIEECKKLREVVELKAKIAERDKMIEEMMAEMRELKAKIDSMPKAGNEVAPVGLI